VSKFLAHREGKLLPYTHIKLKLYSNSSIYMGRADPLFAGSVIL
jgi:hypothetical protein